MVAFYDAVGKTVRSLYVTVISFVLLSWDAVKRMVCPQRAYEALGIACPTSVSNMGSVGVGPGVGFPRTPLTRMGVPRPPGLSDVVPQQQSMQQQLFQQSQPDLQQQQPQLVSTALWSKCPCFNSQLYREKIVHLSSFVWIFMYLLIFKTVM